MILISRRTLTTFKKLHTSLWTTTIEFIFHQTSRTLLAKAKCQYFFSTERWLYVNRTPNLMRCFTFYSRPFLTRLLMVFLLTYRGFLPGFSITARCWISQKKAGPDNTAITEYFRGMRYSPVSPFAPAVSHNKTVRNPLWSVWTYFVV